MKAGAKNLAFLIILILIPCFGLGQDQASSGSIFQQMSAVLHNFQEDSDSSDEPQVTDSDLSFNLISSSDSIPISTRINPQNREANAENAIQRIFAEEKLYSDQRNASNPLIKNIYGDALLSEGWATNLLQSKWVSDQTDDEKALKQEIANVAGPSLKQFLDEVRKKQDVKPKEEIVDLTSQFYRSLAQVYDKEADDLNENPADFKKLLKEAHFARLNCELNSKFRKLVTGPKDQDPQYEKILNYCAVDPESDCTGNPYQITYGGELFKDKASKSAYNKYTDATGKFYLALQNSAKLLDSDDGHRFSKDLYKDVTDSFSKDFASDDLKDKTALLYFDRIQNQVPSSLTNPFKNYASYKNDVTGNTATLKSIEKSEWELNDEIKYVRKNYPGQPEIESRLLTAFLALQNCVHRHISDEDYWPMDKIAVTLLGNYEANVARANGQNCCETHNAVSTQAKNAATDINTKLLVDSQMTLELKVPEIYIRLRQDSKNPMSKADINQLMMTTAMNEIKGLGKPGDKNFKDLSVSEPNFLEKANALAQEALNHLDDYKKIEKQKNEFLKTMENVARDQTLNDEDRQKQIEAISNKVDQLDRNFADALVSKVRKQYPTSNQDYLRDRAFIPHSEYIQLSSKTTADNSTVVTAHYTLPGVKGNEVRDLEISKTDKGLVTLRYWENGALKPVPTP